MNDGSSYDGEFKDDKIEGEGKFTWGPDKIYTGGWKNNCLDGFGVFVKKGKIYIGKLIYFINLRLFQKGLQTWVWNLYFKKWTYFTRNF
jgi:hypothetical protein